MEIGKVFYSEGKVNVLVMVYTGAAFNILYNGKPVSCYTEGLRRVSGWRYRIWSVIRPSFIAEVKC